MSRVTREAPPPWRGLPPRAWLNLAKGAGRALYGTLAHRPDLAEVARRTTRAEIAILTVNWNGDPFIRKCVGEVARLTKAPFVHVVWDNFSTDGSREWLAARPRGVLPIPCRGNLKHDAPLQALSRAVRAPYIIVLDSDAWPLAEGWERALLSAFRHPESRIAGALVEASESLGQPIIQPWLLACRTAWGRRRNWLKAGAGYAWDTAQALSLVAGPKGIVGSRQKEVIPGSRLSGGVFIPGLAFHCFCGSQFHKGGGKAKIQGVSREDWERNRAALWAELESPEGAGEGG